MTRFQMLAAATVVTTLLLVTIGVVVRATDSGMGCPEWPLCQGQFPPLDDAQAWIEWIHRTVAVVVGFDPRRGGPRLRRPPRPASILWPVDRRGPARRVPGLARPGDRPARELRRVGHGAPGRGDVAGRAARLHHWSGRATRRGIAGRGASQRFTLLAVRRPATFALLLFGSHVTAPNAALVFPDWPLMGGDVLPAGRRRHDGPRPPPMGRGRRRGDRRRRRGRGLADAARHPTLVRLAVDAGRPLPDPGARRRRSRS